MVISVPRVLLTRSRGRRRCRTTCYISMTWGWRPQCFMNFVTASSVFQTASGRIRFALRWMWSWAASWSCRTTQQRPRGMPRSACGLKRS